MAEIDPRTNWVIRDFVGGLDECDRGQHRACQDFTIGDKNKLGRLILYDINCREVKK